MPFVSHDHVFQLESLLVRSRSKEHPRSQTGRALPDTRALAWPWPFFGTDSVDRQMASERERGTQLGSSGGLDGRRNPRLESDWGRESPYASPLPRRGGR